MKPAFDKNDFYLGSDGFWYYRVTTPGGKRRTGVCTRERTQADAIKMITATGIDRLEHMAKAGMVTDAAVALITKGNEVTMRDVFLAWSEVLDATVAKATAFLYSDSMCRLMVFCDCHNEPVTAIDEKKIADYIHHGKVKLCTIQNRLSGPLSFFKYAQRKGFVRGNPAELVTIRYNELTVEQKSGTQKKAFSEKEYQSIIKGVTGYWRDATILGYCCGFRISDVACLERASLRPGVIVIYPRKANNAKQLVLPLTDPFLNRPELIELNERLIATIPESATYCFPEEQRDYASRQGTERLEMSYMFMRAVWDVGIRKKGFHSLRRSFAQRLREAGCELEQVQRYMGHGSANTTAIYTGDKKMSPLEAWLKNRPQTDSAPPAEPTVAAPNGTAGQSGVAAGWVGLDG